MTSCQVLSLQAETVKRTRQSGSKILHWWSWTVNLWLHSSALLALCVIGHRVQG